jgi:hypothetical protein
LVYGGSVRKEDGVFENLEDELEMFDVRPSFSDLYLWVKEKFDGEFTLNRRFNNGKTRAHFIFMPLCNEGHWSRYKRVVEESTVTMAEVAWWRMDIGRRMHRPLTALEEMNNNGGSMWTQHRSIWYWTMSDELAPAMPSNMIT